MRPRTMVFVFIVSVFSLMVASVQAQYNPPGSLLSDDELPSEENLRKSLEEARWRWGILRVEPWIGLNDVSFVRTQDASGAARDDFTATMGAGVRGYTRTGRHLIWSAHALPEYTWWRDDEAKTGVNGRYGLGLFAYFNRLDVELSARREQRQSFFSSEIQDLTTERRDVVRTAAALELTKRIHLTASHARTESRNQEDGSPVFTLLDQENEVSRVMLRYGSPRGWWIGGGLEDSERDFDEGARNLSHTGSAELLDLGYDGRRYRLRFNLEQRSLDARDGSDFASSELTTGLLESQWSLHRGLELFVYSRRLLDFSVRAESSSYVSERSGARLDVALRDMTLEVAAEIGADEYEAIVTALPDRVDDVVAYAATLELKLRQTFSLRLGIVHTDYDSSLDRFDRDVTAWIALFQVKGLEEKFRLGDGQKIW